jgi:hypothetical protein
MNGDVAAGREFAAMLREIPPQTEPDQNTKPENSSNPEHEFA